MITAGLARKPGMNRDDLLLQNFEIVKSVTRQVVRYSPDCVIIPVTNRLVGPEEAHDMRGLCVP